MSVFDWLSHQRAVVNPLSLFPLYSSSPCSKTPYMQKIFNKSPTISNGGGTKGEGASKSFIVPSPSKHRKIEMYSLAFYAACTAGGILSCGLTHMAVMPLDLVKCNMQCIRNTKWVSLFLSPLAFFYCCQSPLSSPRLASKDCDFPGMAASSNFFGGDKNDSTGDRESDVGIPLHGLNLGGRKKLLVIDLNGLLAHTFFTFENFKIPANRQPDGILGTKLVFKRPFCDEFLKFCFEKFEVGIWSTATQRNVDGLTTFIFGDFKPKLQFTWNQSHCTSTLFKTLENKDKPIFLKELKKLWDKECHSLPWPKEQYSSSNTLLIDDSPYKALLNPPNTAIFPHKFTVDQIEDNSLGPKGYLRAFLKGLTAAVDVQTYVKTHPYGQDAITANHSDWSYYSKIVGHFPHRLSH